MRIQPFNAKASLAKGINNQNNQSTNFKPAFGKLVGNGLEQYAQAVSPNTSMNNFQGLIQQIKDSPITVKILAVTNTVKTQGQYCHTSKGGVTMGEWENTEKKFTFDGVEFELDNKKVTLIPQKYPLPTKEYENMGLDIELVKDMDIDLDISPDKKYPAVDALLEKIVNRLKNPESLFGDTSEKL